MHQLLEILVLVVQLSQLLLQDNLVLIDHVAILIHRFLNVLHFDQLHAQALCLLTEHLVALLLPLELFNSLVAGGQLVTMLFQNFAQLSVFLLLQLIKLLIRFMRNVE